MARARYLGADDAWKRYCEILDRFAMPDRLVGGNPLYRGEVEGLCYRGQMLTITAWKDRVEVRSKDGVQTIPFTHGEEVQLLPAITPLSQPESPNK